MKTTRWLVLFALPFTLFLAGCSGGGSEEKEPAETDPKVRAALAQLSPEDQQLANAQRICPVAGKRLGSMGKPFKVMVKDQPVLLCCDACQEKALASPDKTLARVQELKEKKD